MANARSNKREIDRAKRERAALKRERRQHGDRDGLPLDESPAPAPGEASAPPTSQADVLDALNVLHEQFDGGEIGFDEFEVQKAELLERLVD